jgi:hypothetical protein
MESMETKGWRREQIALRHDQTATGAQLLHRSSVLLEVLHLAFMLLGFIKSGERPQIAALAGLCTLLPRIQSKLSGFEFANHVSLRCAPRTLGRPIAGPRLSGLLSPQPSRRRRIAVQFPKLLLSESRKIERVAP